MSLYTFVKYIHISHVTYSHQKLLQKELVYFSCCTGKHPYHQKMDHNYIIE